MHPKSSSQQAHQKRPWISRWLWYISFIQGIVILSGFVLFITRTVNQPFGVVLFVSLFLLFFVVSIIQAVCGIVLFIHNKSTSATLFILLLILILWPTLVSTFFNRSDWLGVDVYFVPSASMYPTIKPGQYILVDTWAYRNSAPHIGDVVVVKRSNSDRWIVKRISEWPKEQPKSKSMWFLQGDNKSLSLDSRNFGGVSTQEIIGKASLIIAEVAPNQPTQLSVVLSSIQ